MLPENKYRARAVEWSQVTENEKSGNEEIRVLFEVADGDQKGGLITWYGYFTEATAERTVEALRIMGWTGSDVTDIQDLNTNEVQIVVKHEQYQGKTQAKVAWVNRAMGVYVGTPMSDDKKKAFAARMKGLVVASGQPAKAGGVQRPMQNTGTEFPFGANAPPAGAQPPQRPGVKL